MISLIHELNKKRRKNMITKKTASFGLNERTIERLNRYSESTMTKKSPLVDIAINDYLDDQEFEIEKEK